MCRWNSKNSISTDLKLPCMKNQPGAPRHKKRRVRDSGNNPQSRGQRSEAKLYLGTIKVPFLPPWGVSWAGPTGAFPPLGPDCCSLFHTLHFHTWVPFHLTAFSTLIKTLFIKSDIECQLEFLLVFQRQSDHVLIITRSTFIVCLPIGLVSVLLENRDSIFLSFLASYK